MSYWWKEPYRLIQTNLREIDASLDPKDLIEKVMDFDANVLLINVGGIVAFYPTKLEFHHRNDFLKGDMVRDVIEEAHSHGIKVVGRFDFSKCHREVYEIHPEWFWLRTDGKPVVYNGLYHTCINGGYYQEYIFKILEEALSKYQLDGVFFNMFGYQVYDYSGNYHGICQCDSCKKRFRDMYGKELPLVEDYDDPSYKDYIEFRHRTVEELCERVYSFIKEQWPNIGVMFNSRHSDIIRMEVNRAIDRPLPEWEHWSGEQAKFARIFGKGKPFHSAVVYFIDIPYRFVSESKGCLGLRFAQQLAEGGNLDFYVLGTLDQEDKKGFPIVKEIFSYHKENQSYYRDLKSCAKIGLLYSENTRDYYGKKDPLNRYVYSFRGAYRMLLESHHPFDIISSSILKDEGFIEELSRYELIVMPNFACIDDIEADILDRFVENGGSILATDNTALYTSKGDWRGQFALKSLGSVSANFIKEDMRASYFRVDNIEEFQDTSLIVLDGNYIYTSLKEGVKTSLKLIPPQRYGPPEKCYPDLETSNPGIIWYQYGKGKTAYLPWRIDYLYYRHRLEDYTRLYNTVVDRLLRNGRQVQTNAPPQVGITIYKHTPSGSYIVHLINFSGNNNTAYHEPIPITNIELSIVGGKNFKSAKLLKAGKEIPIIVENNKVKVIIPRLDLFEAVVLVSS